MDTYQGIAASPGYAAGPVHAIRQRAIVPVRRTLLLDEVPAEIKRFGKAVEKARTGLSELIHRLDSELGPEGSDILSSQLMILDDEMVWDATLAVIRLERINAESAFARTMGELAARFLEIEDETFRERVNDLRDVEQRVLRGFGDSDLPHLITPGIPSIISARNLTPSDTALLGRNNVLGFVMDEGGNTSHVAILARSIGVPAIVGLKGRAVALKPGSQVAVDGTDGRLVTDPDQETLAKFNLLTRQQVVINQKLEHLKDAEAITPDGHRVEMMANIELPVEVEEALARGAEGIGLLRTEYLFFQHQTIPTEDDQVRVYSEIVRRMDGRPVIFRTLDVGGGQGIGLPGRQEGIQPVPGLARHQVFPGQPSVVQNPDQSHPPCRSDRPGKTDVPHGDRPGGIAGSPPGGGRGPGGTGGPGT